MKKYLFLGFPIILISVAQILSKFGAIQIDLTGKPINIYVISGYLLLISRGVIWIIIIRTLKLTLAYPLMSFSYFIILLASFFFFRESINVWKISGSLIIMSGITLLYFGEIKLKNREK